MSNDNNDNNDNNRIGFPNVGNTCYINSVLQSILSLQTYTNYIKKEENIVDQENISKYIKRLMNMDADLSGESIQKTMVGICKQIFTKCPYLRFGAQSDAHEFFIWLMNELHQEEKDNNLSIRFTNRNIDTNSLLYKAWIHKIKYLKNEGISKYTTLFSGSFISLVSCTLCDYKNETHENLYSLEIQFPEKSKESHSLIELLDYQTKTEIISDAICEKCKKTGVLKKKMMIAIVPKVLVVQLSRFTFLQGKYIKNETHVSLPTHLNLANSKYLLYDKNSNRSTKYKLCSIVHHFGGRMGGHYVATSQCNGRWILFDDSNVRPCLSTFSPEEASPSPYLAFYEFVDVDSKH